MHWMENWHTGLMWASLLLFVGALFAIARFLANASDGDDAALDWVANEEREFRERPIINWIWIGLALLTATTLVTCVAFAHGLPRNRALPPDGVLWDTKSLLKDFFPSSERVAYERIQLTPEEQAQLRKLTRAQLEKDVQTLFVARSGTRIDGYAFLSGPVTAGAPAAFGVQLDVEGCIKRVEVMRLVDPDQQEVLDPRFVHQFEGRTYRDAPHLHRQIEKPTRCSTACSAATRAVRRALFLVSKLRTDSGPQTTVPPPRERK